MIGRSEVDAEFDAALYPPKTPDADPDPLVEVYIIEPSDTDPWGTTERIPRSRAVGRTRIGQELDR